MSRLIRAVLAAAFVLALSAPAAMAEWSTIKGRIVWGEDKIPKVGDVAVTTDIKICEAKGKIAMQDLIINEKTKGVKYVLVWLGDPDDAKNAAFKPKIHPSLVKLGKDVEIDQPCCMFEPRVVGLREGQNLIVKNPATIAHNFSINSGTKGPNANPLIPVGGDPAKVKGFVAKPIPTPFSCSIHGWMKGYVGVFAHPYFAVTDADGKFEIKNAPEGKLRLLVWHEKAGWVIYNNTTEERGKVIDIKGKTTDVGELKLTLPKD